MARCWMLNAVEKMLDRKVSNKPAVKTESENSPSVCVVEDKCEQIGQSLAQMFQNDLVTLYEFKQTVLLKRFCNQF